jgi:energy-coupling factor transport system permease protein
MRNFRNVGRFSAYHPLAVMLYITTVVAIAVTTDHPLVLSMLVVVLLLHCLFARVWQRLLVTLKFSIGMGVLFVLINPLLSQYGRTILWRGPHIPIIGRVRVTLEALLYGADMGVRFLAVLLAVVVYSAWMEGDQLFLLLRRFGGKSSITISLTARMIPHMTEQVQTVSEVMRVRGVRMRSGSVMARARGHFPLLKVMLIESLEGAWQIAEALQARAFGAAKRTRYKTLAWSKIDLLLVADTLAIWTVFLIMVIRKDTWYAFYPRLSRWFLDAGSYFLFSGLFLLLILPSVFSYLQTWLLDKRQLALEDPSLKWSYRSE